MEKQKIKDYDDFVGEIGEFGLWQKIICLILWVPAMAGGINVLMYSFTGLEPDQYRCKIDVCNATDYDGYIWSKKDKESCEYYEAEPDENGICVQVDNTTKVGCNGSYIFNDFEFERTTITQFNVLCEDKSFFRSPAFTGCCYMIGLLIGSFICGYFSDIYGRRYGLLGCILVSSTASLVGSFMPDYWSYLALRLLTAVGSVGLFNSTFTMTIEFMGSKEIVPWLPWLTYKNLLGNTIQVPYAIGETILGIFAIFIRDYVTLQWVMSMLCYIQLPLWLILPESPRWLLSRGRVEEAKEIMLKGAKWNRKEVDLSELSGSMPENEDKKDQLGFTDLFKTKDMLIITIVMFFNWPIITMGYFGLGLSMTQLGGNVFVDFILGALVEIPGYLLCALLIDVWGRKPFFVCCLLVTGISCIGAGFMKEGALRTGIALCGKLFAAGNFSVVYMYTAEIYPTIIRQTAIGCCSMVARLGGIAAPYIALYLPDIQKELPMLILGGSSVIGGLMAFALPETLGSNLPENIEDVKKLRENPKSLCSCVNPKTLA